MPVSPLRAVFMMTGIGKCYRLCFSMQTSTLERLNPTRSAWMDSAVLVWVIAASAWILGALCLISLTWDGSYYLLQTIQSGTPFIPHRRWFDWVLEMPVVWARPFVHSPTDLAVIQSLACSLLPLFSLAACLGMLREEWNRLRIWPVIGILLVPLPGMLPSVGEVTPSLQLAWVLLAFTWRGCPAKWSPAAALALAAMATLHPVTGPLCFLLAAITATFAWAEPDKKNHRMVAWAVIFGLVALGKCLETALFASPYERDNMQSAVWIEELRTGLRYSPFIALIPVLIERAWAFFCSCRKESSAPPYRLQRALWAISFALGAVYTLDAVAWASSLNYRKFGILVETPVLLMASMEAWRQRRIIKSDAQGLSPHTPQFIPLICPALLFALIFCGMALTWRNLCNSLVTQLATLPGPVMYYENLPKPDCYSALNHWSATSLSLILQGAQPKKVFIWNAKVQCIAGEFHLCPGERFPCENKALKLGWLGGLLDEPTAEPIPKIIP